MGRPPVALVTGAAAGIGAAIARRLAADGWRTVLVDHDADGLDALSGELDAVAVTGDVRDETLIASAVRSAGERFGQLDAVVSNAGIMRRIPVTELGLDDWRAVLDTNLTAAFLLAKHAVPHLREAAGSIVTIASTRASMSEPDTEAYAASKGGLVALTHTLAISLGPRVSANVVSPGWIHTGGPEPSAEEHAFHPAGRVGRPDDVAEAVAWLADGRRSGFLTGAELVIDGGVSRKMIYPE